MPRHRTPKPRIKGTVDLARGKIRVIYCPACDRPHTRRSQESYKSLMERAKTHVSQFHPDQNSDWLKAFPDLKIT